jgi:hypothetical protein
MARSYPKSRAFAGLAACIVGAAAWVAPARASIIISSSPTLPLLGVPYDVAGGACFPTAGFCAGSGAFTLTKIKPGGFQQTGAGELITTQATFSGELTNLSDVPLGTISLSGTVEQDVIGRLNPSDQGTWTVDLVSMSLSGVVHGFTLMLALDPSHTSSGMTSITQSAAVFDITSFFDVFADLTYDTPTPLHATVGPVVATATAAPEPATLALLAGPLLAMLGVRRRRN